MTPDERIAAYADPPRFEPRVDVLRPAQRRIWGRLTEVPLGFVLYGGTGLALRLGHRSSVDFDLFSPSSFVPGELARNLPFGSEAQILQSDMDTLTLSIDGVKISFFGGLSLAAVERPEIAPDNGLLVASLRDLAATELKAILDRAESRDYRDIAAVLDSGVELADIVGWAAAVYGPRLNGLLALKALTLFDQGDLPSLPTALRGRLTEAVRSVTAIPPVAPAYVNLLDDLLP